MGRSVFMRPGVWTAPRGNVMPQWPFALNLDHPYTDGLEFAWVFVPGVGGVDLVGLNKVSAVDNSDSSITFPSSVETGSTVIELNGSSGNDRIDLGSIDSNNPLSLSGGEPCSITLATRLDSYANSFPRIFDKSSGNAATGGWAVYFTSGAPLDRWTIQVNGSGRFHTWTTSLHGIVAGDGIVHWITTNVESTTVSRMWTDGVNSGANDGGGTLLFSSSTTNAAIGNWNHTTGKQTDGTIHFIDVHPTRLLNDAEIYNRHTPGTRWDIYFPLGRVLYTFPRAAAAVAAIRRAPHQALLGVGR